jgi:putative DNA primase/helicase
VSARASDRDSLEALKRRLDADAVNICGQLYGKPTRRRLNEYRWGRKGSVQLIRRKGAWRWTNYESGDTGSILDAIASSQGLDLVGAVAWVRDWLGDGPTRPRTRQRTECVKSIPDVDAEQAQKQRDAVAIWAAARPLAGTPAMRYLQHRRGIGTDFPPMVARFVKAEDIKRCCPQWLWWLWPGALVVAASDATGDVTGVQLIALDQDGQAARHWDDPKRKLKLSLGKLAASAVRLPGDGAAPLLLAEGFETAASVWWATGYETWSLLGSIAKAVLDGVPVSRLVVVCADDDARYAPGNGGLNKAVAQWRREGRTVLRVKPWHLSKGDKSDFNDTLRTEGREAVRDRIEAALKPTEMPALPSVEAARQDASLIIGNVLGELLHWRPCDEGDTAPFKVAKIGVGIGKTKIAVQLIIDAAARGEQIVFLVPTHKLGAELMGRVEGEASRQGVDVIADIWRGREAARPGYPGERMCAELPTVRAARAAKLNVPDTVCKICPHRDVCPHLAQGKRIAQIWLGAHELLLHAPPVPLKGATLLVIDEGFADRIGFIGLTGKGALLTSEEILTWPSVATVSATAELWAELVPYRRKLAAALDGHPNGGLERQRLLEVGLTPEDCRKARALERRCVERFNGAMTWSALKERVPRAAANARGIGKRVMAWRIAEAVLSDEGTKRSGRAAYGMHKVGDATFAALRLYGVESINAAWLRVPTLHLDGTAHMELLRARLPHAELVASIEAATPHQRVVQLTGKNFGKLALGAVRTLDKAWNWAVAYATRRGGDWLVIMPKDAEEAIASLKVVPGFIRVAHFGALRGLDTHRDVAGVIVIGRPMPPPADVERLAGIVTGREVQHRVEGDWYPSETVTVHGRDGSAATVDADRHPDALAEAFRASVAEAELLQAIGRVRGVNRTGNNPVEAVLLGNVPVPGLRLDSVLPWLGPSIDDQVLAEHGTMFEAAAHAATVAGLQLHQVRDRRQRTFEVFSHEKILYGNTAKLGEATYQLAGTGQRRHRVAFDARRIPDIEAFLTERLGALAFCSEGEAKSARDSAHPAIEGYRSGILPESLRVLSRERRRAAAITQDDLARRIGISRPQLANAEQGRFGLSPQAAARWLVVVRALPERQQLLL